MDGLRRLLEQDPAASDVRDANGVSLLMHALYRGRRDLAELIATKKKALDIFEATSLGRLDRSQGGIRDAAPRLPLNSTCAPKTALRPCTSPVFLASPKPPVC